MTKTLSYPTQPSIQPTEEERRSLGRVLVDLFEKNPLANGLFILAIIIGFFHGWLKVHLRSPLTTFAFDIPIVISMLITILTRGKDALIPNSPIGNALKFHSLMCVLYIPISILVFDISPLIVMAAFRGWCIIPMVFVVGFHLATSIRQVEFYMWLIVILGAVTAVYGIFQSEEEVRRLMLLDPEMEFRFRNQFYADKGVSQFRRFSTFVSSAAFATQLSYSMAFAFSRLTVKTCPKNEYLLLSGLSGVMCYALILTGARSALILLVIAVAFALWYRRGGVRMLLLPLIIIVGWRLGVSTTKGMASDRYASLLTDNTIWQRVWIVVGPSITEMFAYPFGTGLGSSSHGVPMFLVTRLKMVRPIDGDLGHIVVDMGLLGLLSIGNLFLEGCKASMKWMSQLRDTSISVVSLPAGIFFILSVITFPIGTPFLGVPYGALLWFFFGALSRLFTDYKVALASGMTESVSFREKFTSFIATPKIRSLYSESEAPGSVSGAPYPVIDNSVVGRSSPPLSRISRPINYNSAPSVSPMAQQSSILGKKRFLFRKNNSKSRGQS